MEVPSATLWLSWKGRRPAVAPIPALALADPPLPGADSGVQLAAARERAAVAVFASGVRLGPLPYARAESRSVVRDLGGGSVQRLGEDASEAFVKTTPLQQFGVLHFATHAVTDETNPDRSGVLLAPGAANQDGLLQIREIVDLGLDGRVVVLSACSSNTGALLRGEGVMSLARAFFQAGAHTVVASLWRLRDDEAADLFDRFYRHLGKGLSVAAALRSAQRDMIAGGAPAAAWAGLVVLGDGDLVPLPGGRKGIAVPVLGLGGGVGLLAGGSGGLPAERTRDIRDCKDTRDKSELVSLSSLQSLMSLFFSLNPQHLLPHRQLFQAVPVHSHPHAGLVEGNVDPPFAVHGPLGDHDVLVPVALARARRRPGS